MKERMTITYSDMQEKLRDIKEKEAQGWRVISHEPIVRETYVVLGSTIGYEREKLPVRRLK